MFTKFVRHPRYLLALTLGCLVVIFLMDMMPAVSSGSHAPSGCAFGEETAIPYPLPEEATDVPPSGSAVGNETAVPYPLPEEVAEIPPEELPEGFPIEDLPLPTPTAGPLSPPAVIPECHRLAIEYVAQQNDIPAEKLLTGTQIWQQNGEWRSDRKEEWLDFPALKQRVCIAKVQVIDDVRVFVVAVDEHGQIVDLESLRAREAEANKSQCGKFDAALCARLPELAEDETVEVAIWLTGIDRGAIYDAIAAQHSAGLQIAAGLPFDSHHPEYRQAIDEMALLVKQACQEKQKPVLDFLEAQGFKAEYASLRSPVVFARLPRQVIDRLSGRDEVVGIYLLYGELNVRYNSGMINWFNLAANALWIVGCALALAVLSYTGWDAALRRQPFRSNLDTLKKQVMLSLAGLLFCLGLAATSRRGWETGVWLILAGWFFLQAGVRLWRSRRAVP
jgi:hypothetical protein